MAEFGVDQDDRSEVHGRDAGSPISHFAGHAHVRKPLSTWDTIAGANGVSLASYCGSPPGSAGGAGAV